MNSINSTLETWHEHLIWEQTSQTPKESKPNRHRLTKHGITSLSYNLYHPEIIRHQTEKEYNTN